ncbi:hypothetical protein N9934_01080 [Desulfosarcina sp.]|nr:hypothetical protein [Desulfosarcina sp.]
MKSAQISQVFIYIMSGIIIVAVLGFGIKYIYDIMGKADEIACVKFKQDLDNQFSKYAKFGSVYEERLKMDCDFRQLCFIDLNYNPSSQFREDYPIIADSLLSNVNKNVFFVNNIAEDFYYIENLKVESGYQCYNNTPTGFMVKLKGDGKNFEMLTPN